MKGRKKTILVTGVAGFIGFHLARRLLNDGYRVVGIDSISDYYDVRLKNKRLALLKKEKAFTFVKKSVADYGALERIVKKERPDDIVHLAAQAGVRYSLVNPWIYADANYLGTMNIFEVARRASLARVIYASSSSVYGGNEETPFKETDRTDLPVSIYGASKRANEILARAYHHLFGTEMIGLRFFTVYGPWGRPDMAYYKFVRRILEGKIVEIYNQGKMKRSFTYIDDIVEAIVSVVKSTPSGRYELYNLGGSEAVPLEKFVDLIEKTLGVEAKKVMKPMQPGDVQETIADTSKAHRELGYSAKTSIEEGIAKFAKWFLENKKFVLSLKEPKQ
jgi:UDP-glucuronate 4-epimerase